MGEPDADERFLDTVAAAVERVVRAAPRSGFGRVLGVGADGTDTKLVDDLAEREILRLVEEAKEPHLNVLSEECGFIDRGAEETLVVDPIDGTTNAARGLPVYCVSLAIGRRALSDVRLGLVRNLATGDVYVARRGGGAFRNGERVTTREYDPMDVVVSCELGVNAKREALALASKRYYVRSFGAAAIEMCFVADGGLDLYYMAQEKLRVIDVAASTLVVREAGGCVCDARGHDLDMDLSLTPRTSVAALGSLDAMDALEVFR